MKANELMIGDWVDFYHPQEPEKKIITRHRITDTFECGLVGISDYNNPVHSDHIKPVKITPEILKKNWFTKHVFGFSFQYFNLYGNLRNDDTMYFTITINGKDITIDYVHQLQHALRLCGIEKTIEL